MRRLAPGLVLALAAAVAALTFPGGGGDDERDGGSATARAATPEYEGAVELPRLAVVEWRCDDRRRFEVAVRVPRGSATTEVVSGSGRTRRLQPGDAVRARVPDGRRHRLLIVQRTSPMTRTARVDLRFAVRPETGLCVLQEPGGFGAAGEQRELTDRYGGGTF